MFLNAELKAKLLALHSNFLNVVLNADLLALHSIFSEPRCLLYFIWKKSNAELIALQQKYLNVELNAELKFLQFNLLKAEKPITLH